MSTPNTGGGHIVVLDATTFAVLGALDADGDVAEVAVSPDGRLVAVNVIGQPTQLFDTTTGESFGDPIGPAVDGGAARRDAVFSTTGDLVMIVGADALHVDLDPASWISRSCALAGRNFTRQEWTGLLGPDVPYEATCPAFPGDPGA